MLCVFHPAPLKVPLWDLLATYFTMVSVSLFVADLILFWASRCVIPSVLTPSMAEMMSPWARLPPTALLPGVIYRGERERGGSLGLAQIPQGTQQEKNICSDSKPVQECCLVHNPRGYERGTDSSCC